MGEIVERQAAIHPEGDPLHGRHGAILEAEVGLNDQRLVGEGAASQQREGEREYAGSGANIHIETP
ncbi:hypothetical protein D3C79_1083960 [compost metagenome]